MKTAALRTLSVLFVWCLCLQAHSTPAKAETIRKPIRAGSFYPAEATDLKKSIDAMTRKAGQTTVAVPADAELKALILPHAGYMYSGWTAAHASLVLKNRHFRKVVLLGPDHFIGLSDGAIPRFDAFETPLGRLDLHPAVEQLLADDELFRPLPPHLDREHALEVVLPFLQVYLGRFELIPVLVGPTRVQPFARALETVLDSETLLVVSSDLSHFLPYERAVETDRETLRAILANNPSLLAASDNRACGSVPVQILMQLAARNHWQPIQLHYANSGDTAGDRSRVVGYAAVAYFGERPMSSDPQPISEPAGRSLVRLARHTIMEHLGQPVPDEASRQLARDITDGQLQKRCATFVTLKRNGQLRGCIGNLTATDPLVESVKNNAVNAAFQDPRFAPLSADELEEIEIEVSVLTEPQPLPYRDHRDLLQKLRVNVDGVILRKGHASATFLPQVWEQLPRPEDFLRHLCMKAGLPADAWKTQRLDVQVYQVQYFEEHI